MANITVKHALDMVQDQAQDEDEDLWDIEDLINWYNQGTRVIVSLDPRANSVIEPVKLASGVRQVCPAGSVGFIGVLRNMGTDGATAGRGVFPTTLEALTAYSPSYSTETAAEVVFNAMPDIADKTRYFVYPPSDGEGYVELEHGKVPAAVVYDEDGNWESNLVGIRENYLDALFNYLWYRMFQKDTDVPSEKSAEFYALFLSAMGMGTGTQKQGEG